MQIEDINIGGSEIGTLLGLNPYQTPMDIYMRKLGLIENNVDNEMTRWGIAAEHVVVRRYKKENPEAIILPSIDQGFDRLNPLKHPNYPWWTGTPDRFVEPDGIIEVKIVGERTAHQWTEDEVPDSYLVQCHYYMGLTGRQWADLCVQIGNRDYRVYRINRDEEMLETLRIAAEDFINNHLVPEIPPPIDASESSKKYLNHTYPQEKGEMLAATPDAERWAEQLALASQQIKHWESIKTLNENLLKNIIGDAKGIQSGNWKATWTKNKDSEKIDWQGIAEYIAHQQNIPLEPFILANTTIKPGTRVFRPYLRALIEEE